MYFQTFPFSSGHVLQPCFEFRVPPEVLSDLVGCSKSFAEKAFSELDEAKKGFVDLSDLRPVRNGRAAGTDST